MQNALDMKTSDSSKTRINKCFPASPSSPAEKRHSDQNPTCCKRNSKKTRKGERLWKFSLPRVFYKLPFPSICTFVLTYFFLAVGNPSGWIHIWWKTAPINFSESCTNCVSKGLGTTQALSLAYKYVNYRNVKTCGMFFKS